MFVFETTDDVAGHPFFAKAMLAEQDDSAERAATDGPFLVLVLR